MAPLTIPGFNYRRPELALHYCQALTGEGLVDARSGLFLAAPRRTGKSTFLRVDLVPALLNQGWVCVYVDLWQNKAADPGKLISTAIKATLDQYAGVIAKLAKKSGLEKLNLFGTLSVNVNALDLPADVTLSDALEALQVAAEKPVAIIIDEAQHAIATEAGMNAMFALKAARDHLNQGGDAPQKLFLIFTGSNQDKLSRLVQKKTQPFFGCAVTKFPLLGKGYANAYTDYVNTKLSVTNQFTHDAVWNAFKLIGQRPEMLGALIAKTALGEGAVMLSKNLESGAQAFQEEIWGEMESEFHALTLIQRAVLVHIIKAGSRFEPFNVASLQAYTQYTGKEVSVSDAQAALNALREKNLVWKANHGDYALEDESMAMWYTTQVKPSVPVLVDVPDGAPTVASPTVKRQQKSQAKPAGKKTKK